MKYKSETTKFSVQSTNSSAIRHPSSYRPVPQPANAFGTLCFSLLCTGHPNLPKHSSNSYALESSLQRIQLYIHELGQQKSKAERSIAVPTTETRVRPTTNRRSSFHAVPLERRVTKALRILLDPPQLLRVRNVLVLAGLARGKGGLPIGRQLVAQP